MIVMVPPGVPKECVDVKISTRDLGDLLSSSAGSIGRFEPRRASRFSLQNDKEEK